MKATVTLPDIQNPLMKFIAYIAYRLRTSIAETIVTSIVNMHSCVIHFRPNLSASGGKIGDEISQPSVLKLGSRPISERGTQIRSNCSTQLCKLVRLLKSISYSSCGVRWPAQICLFEQYSVY